MSSHFTPSSQLPTHKAGGVPTAPPCLIGGDHQEGKMTWLTIQTWGSWHWRHYHLWGMSVDNVEVTALNHNFFFFLERVMGLMPSPRLPPAHIICTVVSKDLTCTEYHRLWHASISEIIPRVTIQARTIPAASLFSMWVMFANPKMTENQHHVEGLYLQT